MSSDLIQSAVLTHESNESHILTNSQKNTLLDFQTGSDIDESDNESSDHLEGLGISKELLRREKEYRYVVQYYKLCITLG